MREFIPLNAYMPVRIGKRGINTPSSPIPRTIIGRATKLYGVAPRDVNAYRNASKPLTDTEG